MSRDVVFVKYNTSDELRYMYEGCPSKSWTFVIKRECLLGIL